MNLLIFLLHLSLQSFAVDAVIIDDFSTPKSHGFKVKESLLKKASHLEVSTISISANSSKQDYYKALEKTLSLSPLVLNLSLGNTQYDSEEVSLLRKIQEKGTYIITAAGNDNRKLSGDQSVYPCGYRLENLLCVGALKNQKKNPLSNYGPYVKFFIDGSYKKENATSFAAPKVSAMVAESLKNKLLPEDVLKQKTILIHEQSQWILDEIEISSFVYRPRSLKDPF